MLDITFPSLHPHLEFGLPSFDFDTSSHFIKVLEPLFADVVSSSNSTAKSSLSVRAKRDEEVFGLSGNLRRNPDSPVSPDSLDVKKDNSKSSEGSRFESDASYQTNLQKEEKNKVVEDEGSVQELDVNFVNAKKQKATSAEITEHQPHAEAFTSNSDSSSDNEPQSKSNSKFYILITVFILLDVVLWVYRISWLSNQLYAARHGYADRIPTDEACKQVLEIQTAYHLPAFENPHDESSGFYVDGKEPLYGSEREADITFLQTLPTPKTKDDILQKIWNEKMNKTEDRAIVRMQKCFLVRWFDDVRVVLNRLFLSQLVWQVCYIQ